MHKSLVDQLIDAGKLLTDLDQWVIDNNFKEERKNLKDIMNTVEDTIVALKKIDMILKG